MPAAADPTKLGCDGHAANGIFDFAGPELRDGKPVYPPNPATPETIADGFERSSTVRHIQGWDLDRPPVREIRRTDEQKQTRRARAFYRNPDGRTIAILEMSWSRGPGWRLDGTQNCTYGPGEPRPELNPLPAPTISIDRSLFLPRVLRTALRLDCVSPLTGATAPLFKRSALTPLRNPDAATDGLLAYVHRLARRDPGVVAWEGSRPPSIVLLFPREPARSTRAVCSVRDPVEPGRGRLRRRTERCSWPVDCLQLPGVRMIAA